MDCKATNVIRLGRLRQTKLPNTLATLPCLEEFVVALSDIMATLRIMREHANDIALIHSRAHRKRKNVSREKERSGGCFGAVPETPVKKVHMEDAD